VRSFGAVVTAESWLQSISRTVAANKVKFVQSVQPVAVMTAAHTVYSFIYTVSGKKEATVF